MAEEKNTEENTEATAAPEEAKADAAATEETAAETPETTEVAAETAAEGEEEVAEEIAKEEAAQQLAPGMVVRVHLKIKDITPKGEERERIQVFEGLIIAKKGQDAHTATITVRKEATGGHGVERIFPVNMPTIDKIEVVRRFRVKQSKLYYLRERRGKKKLKETKDVDSRK